MTDASDVIEVIARALGVRDRAGSMTEETQLFGSLPELDSLGVLDLVGALESEFGIEIADEDLTQEAFGTVGSLTELVRSRVQ